MTIFTLGLGLSSNASGPGGDRTGAPSSSGNCSSCHSGTASNGGDLVISVIDIATTNIVTKFEAGKKYTIGIKMAGTSLRKGFQATVLDATNKFVGSISNVSAGAASYTSGTRTIVGHNTPGLGIWYFDWTAPSTNLTDVTIHASGIVSNSNFNNSGDQVLKSSATLTAATSSNKNFVLQSFKIFPNPSSNQIHFSVALKNLSIISAQGKVVFKGNDVKSVDIINWSNGLYFVQGESTNGDFVKSQFIKQ